MKVMTKKEYNMSIYISAGYHARLKIGRLTKTEKAQVKKELAALEQRQEEFEAKFPNYSF